MDGLNSEIHSHVPCTRVYFVYPSIMIIDVPCIL